MSTETLVNIVLIIIYVVGLFRVSGPMALIVGMMATENSDNIMTWYGKLALGICYIVIFFLSWLAFLMLIVVYFIPYKFIYKN